MTTREVRDALNKVEEKNLDVDCVINIIGQIGTNMTGIVLDFNEPSDCFCGKIKSFNFQHSGKTLDYVRQAVKEKLEREGKQLTINGVQI